MDRRRLKNVIILILLLVNGFLLGALAYRDTAARSANMRAGEQLSALFAADGITLDPAVISQETPPPGRTLNLDGVQERAAAAYLLGKGLRRSDQGGGVRSYTGSGGAAIFRDSGVFEAAGTLSPSGAGTFFRDFCKEFHYSQTGDELDGEDTGQLTAVREYEGLPVYNCQVAFTVEKGAVVSAGGTLLPDTYTESAAGEMLSARAALNAFQKMRRETGAVATAVREMSLCYELQTTTASPMSLTPAWCIVTDTVNYYVNCQTGAVTQG